MFVRRMVFGPARKQEYREFAKRFPDDYVVSLIGAIDEYLVNPHFFPSISQWIEVLRPNEVVIARSSQDVSSFRYSDISQKSHEMLKRTGLSKVSEIFYSLTEQCLDQVATASIDCVDNRLNTAMLNGAGGDFIVRLPGGLAPFLQADLVAKSEAELLKTLGVQINGNNHQDCRYYAHCGHRPTELAEDMEFHRSEISRAKELFQAKGGTPFVGGIRRI